jgi:hypothetical protein
MVDPVIKYYLISMDMHYLVGSLKKSCSRRLTASCRRRGEYSSARFNKERSSAEGVCGNISMSDHRRA